jgi:hypothetical protein
LWSQSLGLKSLVNHGMTSAFGGARVYDEQSG